jgi:hypothetical protein
MPLLFDTLRLRGLACIVNIGCFTIVSIYINNKRFVLKGSEVWLNGCCYKRTKNINSKATLTLKNTVYQRLGLYPYILKYNSKVLVKEDIYSLKLKQVLGNLRKLILLCLALTEHT